LEFDMAFHAYLFFRGNCREAFTRYQEIFGGDLTLLTMADVPSETPVPPEQANIILHAALKSGDALLMASDDPTASFDKVQGISVSYTTNDVTTAERVFNALAEGGEVTAPLSETFFSPGFGMCVDRFGIPWMINTEVPGQAP
jgi:PhnB protein